MKVKDPNIDGGVPFDWGRTSQDYAKFRDIYPQEFYHKIINRGLGVSGQRMLDLGTGTGVLPRHMAGYGAQWTGIDSSEHQIAQAILLSQGMGIRYKVASAETVGFPDHSFDGITACQCFCYFNHPRLAPRLFRILEPGGRFLVLYMAWLPLEDAIAGASEALILKYNPHWSGAGESIRPIAIPSCYFAYFRPG
jgi:ubiquinone/menaquinone biosynthesis C-methylase UbiE